jgi:hypothetical protein
MSGAVRYLSSLEKAFLEETFAFLTKRVYYVLHELPLLSQDFFLQLERHTLG